MKDIKKLKINKEEPKKPKKLTKAQLVQQKLSEEVKFYIALLKKRDSFKTLKPKERLFVINYCLYQGDWEKALGMSGFSTSSRSTQSAKLMQNTAIQDAIEDFWQILMGDKMILIKNKVVDQLYRIAFTKRSKYLNNDGSLKDGITLEDMGDDEVIITNIERKWYGKDADRCEIVITTADRASARRDLIKMFSLDGTVYKKKGNQSTGVLRVPVQLNKDDWEKM